MIQRDMPPEPRHPAGLRALILIVIALGLLLTFLCYGRSDADTRPEPIEHTAIRASGGTI